jgi:hypothetical protein
MKYLTRQEELVLLSVFRLKDNAYLISIQDHLNRFTGKDWSISSVYIPLSRLEKLVLDTVDAHCPGISSGINNNGCSLDDCGDWIGSRSASSIQ